jgi:hypothetical protein
MFLALFQMSLSGPLYRNFILLNTYGSHYRESEDCVPKTLFIVIIFPTVMCCICWSMFQEIVFFSVFLSVNVDDKCFPLHHWLKMIFSLSSHEYLHYLLIFCEYYKSSFAYFHCTTVLLDMICYHFIPIRISKFSCFLFTSLICIIPHKYVSWV